MLTFVWLVHHTHDNNVSEAGIVPGCAVLQCYVLYYLEINLLVAYDLLNDTVINILMFMYIC